MLDARLSRQGVPLITLSNRRAYVWSAQLDGWACVADESFAASQFVPFMSLPGQGEERRGRCVGGGWRGGEGHATHLQLGWGGWVGLG